MLTLLKSSITKYSLLSGIILLLIGYHYISISSLESKLNTSQLHHGQCLLDKDTIENTNIKNSKFIEQLQYENSLSTIQLNDLNIMIEHYNKSNNNTVGKLQKRLNILQDELDKCYLEGNLTIEIKDMNETYFNQIGK